MNTFELENKHRRPVQDEMVHVLCRGELQTHIQYSDETNKN